MKWLFSFNGKVGRLAFALPAVAILFLPHLLILAGLALAGAKLPWLSGDFILRPLRWIAGSVNFIGAPEGVLIPHWAAQTIFLAAAAMTVIGCWILSALAIRRANDARLSGWLALLAITPVSQFPAILLLAAAPSRPEPEPGLVEAKPNLTRAVIVQGLLAGTGLTIFAVALGALVFKTYSFGLFVLSPVVIGVTTSFIANRRADISWGQTFKVVSLALGMGGIGLVICALEGVVCILMAAPLAWAMALIGAAVGRAMARTGRGHPMASIAILPLIFATEQFLPPTIPFADTMSVEIAAPPATVWQAVLHMDAISAAPSLPFRLGVAYPIRGEVPGDGVGAVRLGYFSTGTAVEHVTEWAPGRALGFDIISEPPTLRELSPYKHVNAPHVDGYFRSINARIVLDEIGPGRTRLTLATTHELDLQPAFYWLPMAQWVVRQNKTRVLGQMKAQAEG